VSERACRNSALIAAIALSWQSAAPAAQPFAFSGFEQGVLSTQNVARTAVGVTPLRWDANLAAGAAQYAAELARTQQLVHSPRAGRPGIGENLAQVPPNFTPAQTAQLWVDERRYFFPGTFPNVSKTGNWIDIAHYTALIWPATASVGCGYAPGGGYYWVVCRYTPSGNKDGKPVGYRPAPPTVTAAR
jgi:cysteine-rich secretory family protein